MATINWSGVKSLLDEAATQSRGASSIDAAMNTYNAKVIEALQLMISTAKVNGGITTPNGPVTEAIIT